MTDQSNGSKVATFVVKAGLAQMLKGGVIMVNFKITFISDIKILMYNV